MVGTLSRDLKKKKNVKLFTTPTTALPIEAIFQKDSLVWVSTQHYSNYFAPDDKPSGNFQ